MTSKKSQKRRLRLIRQLQAAHKSLHTWDASLRAAAVQAPDRPVNGRSEAAVLLAIVNEAKQGVNRRLTELGADAATQPADFLKEAAEAAQAPRSPSSNVCVSACRACGRALSAAFREAQSVADAASARILYGPIRALEKQLWVLDPYQAY